MTHEPETKLIELINRDVQATATRLDCGATLDLLFLCYLRRLSRFGYFVLGPITIDVDLIEDVVERSERGVILIYDGQLRKRLELEVDASRGYTSRAGIESPAAGLRLRRV